MWTWLGNVANIIQMLSAIPFLFSAWVLFRRARRYRKRMMELEQALSEKPKALAIGLTGTDISGQVRQFLDKKSMNMEIETYFKEGGITRENIQSLLHDILKIKKKMTADGVTEVHLFLSCPLVFAAAVGAIFDNWVPVKVYHLNRESGQYEFWTSLHKGFIPGLETSTVKEMLSEESN